MFRQLDIMSVDKTINLLEDVDVEPIVCENCMKTKIGLKDQAREVWDRELGLIIVCMKCFNAAMERKYAKRKKREE